MKNNCQKNKFYFFITYSFLIKFEEDSTPQVSYRDHLDSIFTSMEELIANSSNDNEIIDQFEKSMNVLGITRFLGRKSMISNFVRGKKTFIKNLRENHKSKVIQLSTIDCLKF